MKSLLHKLSRLLLVALVFLLAGFFAWNSYSQGSWLTYLDVMLHYRFTVLCYSVAAGSLSILYILTGIRSSAPNTILTYDNEGGAVSISSKAITEVISKVSDEFSSVMNMRPRIFPGRNSIDIVVDVRIKASADIKQICEALQERVRSCMKGLGIIEIRKVIVNIQTIVPQASGEMYKAVEAGSPLEDPDPPISN